MSTILYYLNHYTFGSICFIFLVVLLTIKFIVDDRKLHYIIDQVEKLVEDDQMNLDTFNEKSELAVLKKECLHRFSQGLGAHCYKCGLYKLYKGETEKKDYMFSKRREML